MNHRFNDHLLVLMFSAIRSISSFFVVVDMAHLRMVYYDGGKTTTSTQSSLTNKALLIKYFVVSSIAKSFCLLSHYYPDMPITVGESYSAWQQKLKKCSGFWYRRVWLEKGRQLTRSQKRKKTPTIVQSAGTGLRRGKLSYRETGISQLTDFMG